MRARWHEFSICLAGIFTLAIGEGAYLVLIVAYLERRHVPVAEIGMVMAFLSIMETVATLAAGVLPQRRSVVVGIIIPLLLQATSALLMALQPLGLIVWVSAGLNGAGMGIAGVSLYATTLERRPEKVALGAAIGWYTGLIAAGNGVGAVLSGILTDRYGFGAAFGLSTMAFLVATSLMILLQVLPAPRAQEAPAATPALEASVGASGMDWSWVWMLAVLTGLALACINTTLDTLFPIYGLRAGLSMTLIGALDGLKAFLAAIVRPLSGMVLHRINLLRANTASLLGLAGTVMAVPWAGLGAALALVMAAVGVAFGAVRVTSATLVLDGDPAPPVAKRRISYYNASLTVGAIVGPWVAGWVASILGLSLAITLVPAFFVVLFVAALYLLPRLRAFSQAQSARST